VDKQELLLEAELEIVARRHRRSRSRSFVPSQVTDIDEEEDDLYVPGGWKSTPGKRKRPTVKPSNAQPSVPSAVEGVGRPWGVAEWKALEKVYRSEKDEWVKHREIKKLPGSSTSTSGWLGFGWGRKVEESEVKDWDVKRVVNRFIIGQHAEQLVGEWDV